jgi:hypothetical protein
MYIKTTNLAIPLKRGNIHFFKIQTFPPTFALTSRLSVSRKPTEPGGHGGAIDGGLATIKHSRGFGVI